MNELARRRPMKELLLLSLLILGVWLSLALFNTSEFYRRSLASGQTANWQATLVDQSITSLIWATFTPIVWAIAERLPIYDEHWKRNILVLAGVIPLLSVIRAAGGGLWLRLGEHDPMTLSFAWLSIMIRFHRNCFLILAISGLVNILLAYRRSVSREQKAWALQAEVTNAALAQLRAAMLPRVMFDTLHAIADRVGRDPMQADRLIVGLSDLLRATLDLDHREEITLAEELEHIDRYLDLERTRADGNLTTHIDFDEPLLGARVPPLVLHTLVEHVLSGDGRAARRLRIRGREDADRLSIEIETDGPPSNHAASSLDDASVRLKELLMEHFSFDRQNDGTTDIVTLELPLRVSEATS